MINRVLQGQSLEWLLKSASEAMLIADGAGSILVANSPAEQLFGYSEGDLNGKSIESLIPERLRTSHKSLRQGFAAHAKARSMGSGIELFACRRDSSEFPVEISLSPLQGIGDGDLVMATIHDITRRKHAETALQESEARMRAIFETVIDAIVTIDENGIVERFNPAAENLFGYLEVEVAGRNVSMLMPSPYREMHDKYLLNYRETGVRKIIGLGREVMGLRKDGTVFPMDLSVGEMQLGTRRMFAGIVRDITERKRTEEERAGLLREISSANEELTNFAYVVSHDLKAPLRAISALADWLSTDYADKFDAEGKEHMRLLISRVHRMSGLIDGILQYSRIGRVKETPMLVDLNRLVRDVIHLLAPPAGIDIVVEAALPSVMTEPVRIQQVFQNLISNAIKYMDKPEGKIRIGCVDDGGSWRFSVADNGPGIEQRHFERIFQLFQTLAPRDRVESTGVGLSLVRKILEMYNGRVWLESRVGEGTTFYFILPKPAKAVRSIKGDEA